MKHNIQYAVQKYKRVTQLVGVVVFTLIITTIIFLASPSQPPPPDSTNFSLAMNVFLKCETIEDKIERYSCYKDMALYALENGRSVEELSQYASDYHLRQHSVGRAMLLVSEYNLEAAIERCKPNCIAPYYHALAEEWGEYAPTRQKEFVDFLNGFCPLEESGHEGCYHHVGHFYVSANKNLDMSLALCDKLEDNDRFYKCSYGVVHEQFIQSNAERFFQQCSKYTDRKKTACYTIGSRLYPKWLSHKIKNMEYPLELCDELNAKIPLDLNYCYASTAWVLAEKGREIPDIAWCDRLDTNFKKLCVDGLLSPKPFWDVLGCSIGGALSCGR